MDAKRILSKGTGKFEKGAAGQSRDKAPEAAVKTEEESCGAMTAADTEGPEYKREAIEKFKVLEKGDIFFFYRHKVHGTGAHGIQDVARSFIVLRPTSPWTASEVKHSSFVRGARFRLLVVPKKVLPKYGGVKEMGFVEKAQVTLKELQETFLAGFDYVTQTHGATTMPEAKPYANGVYTITSTHQGSYLAYILTGPTELGPVQKDFGLRKQGSWLVQSKNPKAFSPPSVRLPECPDYPESLLEKFGERRWVPLRPELIDYPNAQFLLIGRSGQVPLAPGNVKHEDHEVPNMQLEGMAHDSKTSEQQFRGVDSIYGDLDLEVYHYLKISTTWDQS